MKRLSIAALMAGLVAMGSCAKSPTTDNTDRELASLEAWINKYHPETISMGDGGYYKLVEAGESNIKPSLGDWVRVNYTAKTLDGVYYKNYYKTIAYDLGTFAYTTHFVPEYVQYDSAAWTHTEGMFRGVGMLNVGDSVSLYLASSLGYGTVGTSVDANGFEGELQTILPNTSININMKLMEVVKDPEMAEQNEVESYAQKVLNISAADSIEYGYYLKVIEPNPEGEPIGSDSLVYIRYSGYFLDGFVFDTNDEEVAIASKRGTENDTYTLFQYQSSGDGTDATSDSLSVIRSWSESILKMRKGERAIILSTSDWAYDSIGSSAGTTMINPYTPLLFDIEILTDEEYEEETTY